MRKALIVPAAIAAMLGAGAIGTSAWLYRAVIAPGPLPQPRDVDIARGSTAQIAAQLQREGAISSIMAFRAAALLTSRAGHLHAAEFTFPAHASILDSLRVLRSAKPVEHRLTFPEGVTAARVAEILAAAPTLTGPVSVPPEAYVLPQTYAHQRGTPAAAILARAHAALQARLVHTPPGMSAQELLTLASLVERESARADERPMIAAVFLNRLRLGMRLQTDPATIYGASGGTMDLGRALSRADLVRADPYNTYVVPALPAGPICAPGAASIDAVLHPAQTDALYFVADGKGGHAFARSLAEHQRNVARLRALQGGG